MWNQRQQQTAGSIFELKDLINPPHTKQQEINAHLFFHDYFIIICYTLFIGRTPTRSLKTVLTNISYNSVH